MEPAAIKELVYLVTTWTEGPRSITIWAIGHGQHSKDTVIKFDIETGERTQE